jgi:magnesium chelatase family protein
VEGTARNALTRLHPSVLAPETRILKVSRTLADMEGKDKIESGHVNEAIQYRTLDQFLGLVVARDRDEAVS